MLNMGKLYRVVWNNPETKKKNSTWWMGDIESCKNDKERIEKEMKVTCEVETREF